MRYRRPPKRSLKEIFTDAKNSAKKTLNKVVTGAHKGYNMYKKISTFMDEKGLSGPAKAFFEKNAPEQIKDAVSDLKRMANNLPEGVKDVVKRGKMEDGDAYRIVREVADRHTNSGGGSGE